MIKEVLKRGIVKEMNPVDSDEKVNDIESWLKQGNRCLIFCDCLVDSACFYIANLFKSSSIFEGRKLLYTFNNADVSNSISAGTGHYYLKIK